MNVRQALDAVLRADGVLIGMLAHSDAIYHRRAPGESGTPLVIIDKQAGRPRWVFGSRSGILDDELWTVKAVSLDRDAIQAEDIAARIDTVLTDAALDVDARTVLWVRRESDVDFGVDEGQFTWQHVGAVYRVVTERA